MQKKSYRQFDCITCKRCKQQWKLIWLVIHYRSSGPRESVAGAYAVLLINISNNVDGRTRKKNIENLTTCELNRVITNESEKVKRGTQKSPRPKILENLWMTKTTRIRITLRVVIKSWCVCVCVVSHSEILCDRFIVEQNSSHSFSMYATCANCVMKFSMRRLNTMHYHCYLSFSCLTIFSFFNFNEMTNWMPIERLNRTPLDFIFFIYFTIFFSIYFWFYRLYYSTLLSSFSLFSILFGSLKFQN